MDIKQNHSSSLVSVIIPLYNAEKYIVETIDSVLAQTYSNIEIIVVDDYSTDKSFKLVSNIKSDKILVVENLKKGACSARNYGFELSKGEYIQYLDADDIISPLKIESQINALKLLPHNTIAFGDWYRFFDTIENTKKVSVLLNKDYDKPVDCLVDCWNGLGMIPVHSWLTPRNIVKKAGNWNESLLHNQDGEFFSRVLVNANSLKFCANSTVYYRSGIENSISSSSKGEKNAESQLCSFKLYVRNLKAFNNNQNLKLAMANNFLQFIYRFYGQYPSLVIAAEEEFKKLKVGKMWAVGGRNFKLFASIIGFKSALKLKYFYKK